MFFRAVRASFPRQSIASVRYQSTQAYTQVLNTIRNDLKASIRKKGDPLEKNVIRGILNEVKNYEVDNQSKTHDEFTLFGLLNKMIKQRQEAADIYIKEQNGKPSEKLQQAADNELAEISYIRKYVDFLDVAKPEDVEAKVTEIAQELKNNGELTSIKVLMSKMPWKITETEWKAPRPMVASAVAAVFEKLK